MRIEPADTSSRDEIVAFILARHPGKPSENEVAWPFDEAENVTHLRVHVARDDDGTLVGVVLVAAAAFLPPDWVIVRLSVAAGHEGRGIGTALRDAVEGEWPPHTTEVRSLVYDDDERSLAVARHWGYQADTHGITSDLAFDDLPEPKLPHDVTIELTPDWRFPDRDAVAAMLAASQTNPEAVRGTKTTLDQLSTPSELSTPVVALARVDGVPAGIVAGDVQDEDFSIHYSGIDPAFRGRGLAVLLKQRAHLEAKAAGATSTRTTNEASNAGIRRINAELGYQVAYGAYRMLRRLP